MSILEIVLLSYSISLALSITLALTLPSGVFRNIGMFVASLLLPWFIVITLIDTILSRHRAKRMEQIHAEMRARDQAKVKAESEVKSEVKSEAKKKEVNPNGK